MKVWSILAAGKRWLPQIGLYTENSLSLNFCLNCAHILRVKITTGLDVNLDGENGNFAVIKTESEKCKSSPQFCTIPVLEPDKSIWLVVYWMPSNIFSYWEVLGHPGL